MKQSMPFADMPLVTAYGSGYVVVAGMRYERSLLISPDGINGDWGPTCFGTLSAAHLSLLNDFYTNGMRVLLLGTGAIQRFLAPDLLDALGAARFAVEPMSTAAACRTYNILASEGRPLVCALVVDRESSAN